MPIAGDIMASRWAFEALAVDQYKNNRYESHFYAYDKQMKMAEFKKNFWLSKLREKISFVHNNIKVDSTRNQVQIALKLLRNEIGKELHKTRKRIPFNALDKLNINDFNDGVYQKVNQYLMALNQYYIQVYNTANSDKDALIVSMNKTPGQKKAFIKLKNEYTNDALSDLVTNKNEFNKIIEKGTHLYQKANPVYLDPLKLRAHFFAPRKLILGEYISTYAFNNIVIWVMSLVMVITLYFDTFRKILVGFEKMFSHLRR